MKHQLEKEYFDFEVIIFIKIDLFWKLSGGNIFIMSFSDNSLVWNLTRRVPLYILRVT
jgi:hypothetical protein